MSTDRGWPNAAFCWRRNNPSRTKEAGTIADWSDDEMNGREPRRLRPWSKTEGHVKELDIGVDQFAPKASHRDLPSANILRNSFLTAWMWRSTSPLDYAYSGLDVTWTTFIVLYDSRNSALVNCVPLSDSKSSRRPKSQNNLDISSINADNVMDFRETTQGHFL